MLVSCSVRSWLSLRVASDNGRAKQRSHDLAKWVTQEQLSRTCVRSGHNPLTELVRDFGLNWLAVFVARGFLLGQGGCECTGGEPLCVDLLAAIFYSIARPCVYIIIGEAIASEQRQHSLVPTFYAVEQPDSWQSCRLHESLPARGAQRAPNHNLTRCLPSQSAHEPLASPSQLHQTRSNAMKNEGHQKRSKTMQARSPKIRADQKAIKNGQHSAFPDPGPIAGPSPATKLLSPSPPLA